ncbi:hypothetical protein AMK26_10415 [Streptomyces sp. CB03234]|uniref:DUF7352 domain-containing protein n=1 Tax=Streptomyces sp. (strain CB03234) TaxID=1703937 RepID=UPI00093DDF88|nr:hypothetical protein [Streptomyces sp. CB03234]OKK06426.1 hypothetical protein AMK26_10415 [Streptomyces sp. CB03234]
MPNAIYRYEIPVDDQWHELELTGAVLHTAARTPDVVELWALHTTSPTPRRSFRVFGTGQPLPAEPLRHVGTALTAHGALVWHVMERV